MICNLVRYQAAPEKLDEVIRLFKEQAIPLASKQAGFKGTYLLTKPSGLFTILNMWDTQEQANAWTENAENREIVSRLMSLLQRQNRSRDSFEVSAQAVA